MKNCTVPLHVPLWVHEHVPHERVSVTDVPTVEATGQLAGHDVLVGTIMHALNGATGASGRQARPDAQPAPPLGS